jgi:hypothetical protein
MGKEPEKIDRKTLDKLKRRQRGAADKGESCKWTGADGGADGGRNIHLTPNPQQHPIDYMRHQWLKGGNRPFFAPCSICIACFESTLKFNAPVSTL